MDVQKTLAETIARFPDKHLNTALHGFFGGILAKVAAASPADQAEFVLKFMPREAALNFVNSLVLTEPPVKPEKGYGLATIKAVLDEVLATPPKATVIDSWTKEQRVAVYDWAIREKAWMNDKKYNRKAKPLVLHAFK